MHPTGTSRKTSTSPSVSPPIPSSPMCGSLSQPSGEGRIQEIIESSPKQDLLDLQPNQRPTSGPSDQVPPRRSERVCLQQERKSGLVTRSQTRKDAGDDTSTLVYEINEDNYLEHSKNKSESRK